jgi:hypothetical protein
MYILINKKRHICYPGDDLGIVSHKSGKSINTLRSWIKKFEENWFENLEWILIKSERLKGRRGGLNEGNKHLFNK